MTHPNWLRFTLGLGLTLGASALVHADTTTTTTTTQETTVEKSAPAGSVTIRHEAIRDEPEVTRIVVKKAPPEPKQEVIRMETKPDEKAIWVPGYWRWDETSNTYDWVSGSWRRAIPDEEWHPGRWEKTDEGYVWRSGYWGPKSEMKLTIVKEAPPEPKKEDARPDSPGPDYVWVSGYWSHDQNEYVWHPGKWQKPPTEKMIWRSGKWINTTSGYEYIPGHWDYPAETRTYRVSIQK